MDIIYIEISVKLKSIYIVKILDIDCKDIRQIHIFSKKYQFELQGDKCCSTMWFDFSGCAVELPNCNNNERFQDSYSG